MIEPTEADIGRKVLYLGNQHRGGYCKGDLSAPEMQTPDAEKGEKRMARHEGKAMSTTGRQTRTE